MTIIFFAGREYSSERDFEYKKLFPMTFSKDEETETRSQMIESKMAEATKEHPVAIGDKFCEHTTTTTKKKHANPFSVEYILSCESSKRMQSRNITQMENKQSREALDYSYVNKGYNSMGYTQPPAATTPSDVETIGMFIRTISHVQSHQCVTYQPFKLVGTLSVCLKITVALSVVTNNFPLCDT